MHGHTDKHIADRISWKIKSQIDPDDYISVDKNNIKAIVICHNESLVINTEEIIQNNISIALDDLKTCSKNIDSFQRKGKEYLDKLDITTKSGRMFTIRTPPGKYCFAIWNTLIMLSRMQKRKLLKIIL